MKPLEPENLRPMVDPEKLGFEYISELGQGIAAFFGQARAEKALDFGLDMDRAGFNVFVAGLQEAGALELTRARLERMARKEKQPPGDICYLHNFKNPDSPVAVELERGLGQELRKGMMELVDNLRLHMPKNFEGETYLVRKEEVIRGFNKKRAELFEELDKKVREKQFILQADPTGMMVIPAKPDGSPMSPEEIMKLSQEDQDLLKKKSEELHREMGATMRQIHQFEQDVRQQLKELNREVAKQTVEGLLKPLKEKFASEEKLQEYFDLVQEDVILHFEDFRPSKEVPPPGMPVPLPGMGPSFVRYEVNVLVDNSRAGGRPVIFEANPSYPNLFGAIERKAQFGALFTDFTMIKAGALHRANGGYLLLKVADLLKKPFSYEALKRTLRTKKLEIEDPGEQLGLFTTKSLKPEPIELRVKIVLMGEPFLYQLLYSLDEDFRELFKVKAHLDVETDRTDSGTEEFLRTVASMVSGNNLKDLDKTGAARLIEYSSELADCREKLSLKVNDIEDLLLEADFWAGKAQASYIMREHVQKAIDEKKYRSGLYQEHLQEMLVKDIIKVSTSGKAVGQINGLAVYDAGDQVFGKPSRITVNISLGKDGVVNIEREAKLSGKIHTKGVMILSGYLRSKFVREKPLSLTASICFEQSYGMIDGDSASGAELFALLSAISGIPLSQEIACTGAVSQKGEVLPVGGVTAKIEGFFDLCRERGFSDNQGVIIPRTNIRDLTLKTEVIDAVKEEKFHIWAIETVDDAMELLTGMEAGRPDEKGNFPEETVYFQVERELDKLAELVRKLARENRGNDA